MTDNTDLIAWHEEMAQLWLDEDNPDNAKLHASAATALRAADAEIARLSIEVNNRFPVEDYAALHDENEARRTAITAALAKMPSSVTDAYDILSDALSATAPVSQPSEAEWVDQQPWVSPTGVRFAAQDDQWHDRKYRPRSALDPQEQNR